MTSAAAAMPQGDAARLIVPLGIPRSGTALPVRRLDARAGISAPPRPTREQAVRQFAFAAKLKRASHGG